MPTSRHLSRIILSKGIKLDRSYTQVLAISETNMINLMLTTDHLVSSKTDYSFIRERGSIKVGETYGNCLKANYIAFQNTDYSGKWFFAFIDKVKYISETATEIYYTIDVWTTWFDYWNPKSCYIVRQHATTDVAGDNLVPEKLEHGEYVQNAYASSAQEPLTDFSQYAYLVVLSSPIGMTPTATYTSLGGVIMNGFVYWCEDADAVGDVVAAAVGSTTPQIDVLYAYMIPDIVFTGQVDENGLVVDGGTPYSGNKKVLSRPTTIDGYSPVNKKLLTYPYQYCLFQNMAGASNILFYEYSGKLTGTSNLEAGAIYIQYYGVPSIGGSVVAIPKYYKNQALSFDNLLVLGKYPTLGWSEDAYTNWLTQNAVNLTSAKALTGIEIIGGIGMIAGGLALSSTGAGAVAGTGMISNGIGSLMKGGGDALELAGEYYNHSLEPDSYKGNTNAGDIITCIGAMGYEYKGMSITRQYAEKIDHFFTRFGYAVNDIASPNMLHRANYNYVQISKDSTTAFSNNANNICVPATDLEMINNMFRNGVTIWNNHTNFGDYSVANGITS